MFLFNNSGGRLSHACGPAQSTVRSSNDLLWLVVLAGRVDLLLLDEHSKLVNSVTVEAMHCFFLRWEWLTAYATPIQLERVCILIFRRYRGIKELVNTPMTILTNDGTLPNAGTPACHIAFTGNKGHLICARFISSLYCFMPFEAA